MQKTTSVTMYVIPVEKYIANRKLTGFSVMYVLDSLEESFVLTSTRKPQLREIQRVKNLPLHRLWKDCKQKVG